METSNTLEENVESKIIDELRLGDTLWVNGKASFKEGDVEEAVRYLRQAARHYRQAQMDDMYGLCIVLASNIEGCGLMEIPRNYRPTNAYQ